MIIEIKEDWCLCRNEPVKLGKIVAIFGFGV